MVWTGSNWIRIGTSGGFLWKRWWTFGFLKIAENFSNGCTIGSYSRRDQEIEWLRHEIWIGRRIYWILTNPNYNYSYFMTLPQIRALYNSLQNAHQIFSVCCVFTNRCLVMASTTMSSFPHVVTDYRLFHSSSWPQLLEFGHHWLQFVDVETCLPGCCIVTTASSGSAIRAFSRNVTIYKLLTCWPINWDGSKLRLIIIANKRRRLSSDVLGKQLLNER
jgi:hypothetical protein